MRIVGGKASHIKVARKDESRFTLKLCYDMIAGLGSQQVRVLDERIPPSSQMKCKPKSTFL